TSPKEPVRLPADQPQGNATGHGVCKRYETDPADQQGGHCRARLAGSLRFRPSQSRQQSEDQQQRPIHEYQRRPQVQRLNRRGLRSVRSASLLVPATGWLAPFGCTTALAVTNVNSCRSNISRITSLTNNR